MRRIMCMVVIAAILASTLFTPSAGAHEGSCNAVYQDKKIYYYVDVDKWGGALDYAVAAWNQVNADFNYQGVEMVEVFTPEEATVIVQKKDISEKGIGGEYRCYYYNQVDYIWLDPHWMNNASKGDRKRLIMHEVGHSLQLQHNDLKNSSIMYPCPTCTSLTEPGSHDRDDFYAYWVQGGAVPMH